MEYPRLGVPTYYSGFVLLRDLMFADIPLAERWLPGFPWTQQLIGALPYTLDPPTYPISHSARKPWFPIYRAFLFGSPLSL